MTQNGTVNYNLPTTSSSGWKNDTLLPTREWRKFIISIMKLLNIVLINFKINEKIHRFKKVTNSDKRARTFRTFWWSILKDILKDNQIEHSKYEFFTKFPTKSGPCGCWHNREECLYLAKDEGIKENNPHHSSYDDYVAFHHSLASPILHHYFSCRISDTKGNSGKNHI